MRRPKAVEKIRRAIRSVAPKAEIILFGSEARGDATPDSDFDVLILEDRDVLTFDRIAEITTPLYNLLIEEGIDVQPMVKTKREWENRPFKTPFYCNVMNEGISL